MAEKLYGNDRNLMAFHNINVAGDDYCRRLLATPDGILVAGVLGGEGFISKIQTTTLEEIWFKTYSSASATPRCVCTLMRLAR